MTITLWETNLQAENHAYQAVNRNHLIYPQTINHPTARHTIATPRSAADGPGEAKHKRWLLVVCLTTY